MGLIEHGKPWIVRNVDGGPLVIRDMNGVEPWLTVGESVEVVPVELLRGAVEALQGILDAWPRHLFNVPQEAVDQFVAAMDEGQAVVDRLGGQ